MKKHLIIVGASGHGKVIADIALKMNQWEKISFLDDDESLKTSLGLEVIGKTKDAFKHKTNADFFVAIGKNDTRERVLESFIQEGLSIATLVHPSAIIGIGVEIGIGTAIMAGVVINSSTLIGKGCIINTSSSIDHDNVIEDYVHVSPGVRLAGTVIIGKKCWLGIGSSVSNNINISSGCILGAGGCVINSIEEPGIYVGLPARRIIS